ncbi:hypothetical protein [Natronincola ferrireducens]|nr:hypothetical protein [Natronincola ferrireducens]
MEKSTKENLEIKEMIEALETSLHQVAEAEGLQGEIHRAYRVPYPIPIKYNVLVGFILYMLYRNGLALGGWLLLGWFGWQICVNVVYFMLQLYRKMPEIARWKDKVNTNIEELEKTCIVPQKYWYSSALQHFIKYLKSGRAKTIQQCIEIYEED